MEVMKIIDVNTCVTNAELEIFVNFIHESHNYYNNYNNYNTRSNCGGYINYPINSFNNEYNNIALSVANRININPPKITQKNRDHK